MSYGSNSMSCFGSANVPTLHCFHCNMDIQQSQSEFARQLEAMCGNTYCFVTILRIPNRNDQKCLCFVLKLFAQTCLWWVLGLESANVGKKYGSLGPNGLWRCNLMQILKYKQHGTLKMPERICPWHFPISIVQPTPAHTLEHTHL